MLMPCRDVLCLLRCPTLGQDVWRNMGQSPRGAALLGSTQPWDHFRSTRAEPSPVCTNLLPSPIAPESKAELSDGSDRHVDAVEMSQTKLQLQGRGTSLQSVPSCRKSAALRRQAATALDAQGEGTAREIFLCRLLGYRISRCQHPGLLSLILTLSRNKRLKDKPDRFVLVCFVCLFIPEHALPWYSLVSGVAGAVGGDAGAGSAPLAWAVAHVPPLLLPRSPPAPSHRPLLSRPQERLQGAAV